MITNINYRSFYSNLEMIEIYNCRERDVDYIRLLIPKPPIEHTALILEIEQDYIPNFFALSILGKQTHPGLK